MSGVHKCRLRRHRMIPRYPVPPKKVVEPVQVNETPAVIIREESVEIIAEAVPVKTEPVTEKPISVAVKEPVSDVAKTVAVKEPVKHNSEPAAVKEPVRHNSLHLFNNEPVQQIAKRTIHDNPLLRRRF